MKHPTATTAIATPVDLEIRVNTKGSGSDRKMEFVLNSPSKAVGFANETIRGEEVRAPREYQKSLLGLLENLTAGHDEDGVPVLGKEAEEEVIAIGQQLYDELFPREMRSIYEEIRDSVNSLLIVSNEPWIPWEILHPEDSRGDFLCVKHQMSRWLTGTVHLADTCSVQRIACVDAGDASDLEEAGEELKLLRNLSSKTPGLELLDWSGASWSQISQSLESESFDSLHFAGHGRHGENRVSGSKIELVDRSLRPRHLLRAREKLARDRPLVFFNSCQVGRLGVSLTELSGWAPHWIRKCECSAYLAPIWAVGDELAFRFAEVFYESLVRGTCLARAVQHARVVLRKERPGDISWLAYSLYGPPNVRVSFGEPRTTVSKPISKTPAEPDLPEARQAAPHLVEARRLQAKATSQATADRAAPQGSRRLRATPQLVKTALGSIAAAGVVLLLVFPPPWGDLQGRLETASEPQTHFDNESSGTRQEMPPPSAADPETSAAGEAKNVGPESSEGKTSILDHASGSGPQDPTTDAGLEIRPEPVISAPPPPPPASIVPLGPLTKGKTIIIALDSSNRPDDALGDVVRSVLKGALLGLSFEIPHLSSEAADLFARGSFPAGASAESTPWAAEYLVVTKSTREPLAGSPGKKLMLTMESEIIDAASRSSIAYTSGQNHTGMGGDERSALIQATERCLKPVIDQFHQGDPE